MKHRMAHSDHFDKSIVKYPNIRRDPGVPLEKLEDKVGGPKDRPAAIVSPKEYAYGSKSKVGTFIDAPMAESEEGR